MKIKNRRASCSAACFISLMFITNSLFASDSEVVSGMKEIIPASEVAAVETNTDVKVRNHPLTGIPYVGIVSKTAPGAGNILFPEYKKVSRPDYRMLDCKMKSGEIPYDGPTSNRTKVYVFAASLATAGVLGGTLLPVVPATGAAAGGGAQRQGGRDQAGEDRRPAPAALCGPVASRPSDVPRRYPRLRRLWDRCDLP